MTNSDEKAGGLRRRTFLATSAAAVGAVGNASAVEAAGGRANKEPAAPAKRPYNGPYTGEHLSRVAFPLGGHRRRDDLPGGHAAPSRTSRCATSRTSSTSRASSRRCASRAIPAVARVLEGPVPALEAVRRAATPATGAAARPTACRASARASFVARFPFGTVTPDRRSVPLTVELTGWSPFEPGDADSSQPARGRARVRVHEPTTARGGGLLVQRAQLPARSTKAKKAVRARPAASCSGRRGPEGDAVGRGALLRPRRRSRDRRSNAAWFRGGWFDPLTIAWKDVAEGACHERAADHRRRAGAGRRRSSSRSRSRPGETKTIALRLVVVRGLTNLARRQGPEPTAEPPPCGGTLPAVVRGALRQHRRGRRATGAASTRRCARRRPASRLLLRHDAAARGGRGRRREPHDPQVADRAAPGRRPALGLGRLLRQLAAAATAPARTSGTTRRRCRTCSPRSSARCARRSSASRRTRAGTRRSARRCRSGPRRTTSTPRPTASSAGS